MTHDREQGLQPVVRGVLVLRREAQGDRGCGEPHEPDAEVLAERDDPAVGAEVVRAADDRRGAARDHAEGRVGEAQLPAARQDGRGTHAEADRRHRDGEHRERGAEHAHDLRVEVAAHQHPHERLGGPVGAARERTSDQARQGERDPGDEPGQQARRGNPEDLCPFGEEVAGDDECGPAGTADEAAPAFSFGGAAAVGRGGGRIRR